MHGLHSTITSYLAVPTTANYYCKPAVFILSYLFDHLRPDCFNNLYTCAYGMHFVFCRGRMQFIYVVCVLKHLGHTTGPAAASFFLLANNCKNKQHGRLKQPARAPPGARAVVLQE